ncbi:MAG: DUF1080 domain-containing protein [Acidobacteriota bacterium]|nr:DUF1080 domain-containing protein [Acidobacteriota bacterium]
MSKFIITATYMLAFALAVACNASTGIITSDESSSEPNIVQPEAPAPVQESGKSLAYNFDSDAAGSMPSKFHDALTGKGSRGQWTVKADSTAPSAPNVLAQTSADKTSYRFPVAIADEGSFRDLDLSVRFKAISGRVDQAAGLVWRLRDANNYYIVRANALENNVVLYKVQDGKRTDLPVKGEGRTYGKKAQVPANQWSELRVVQIGNIAEVFLNNTKLYEVEDDTFKDAGKVGLWTKADSVTYFDDLRVMAK